MTFRPLNVLVACEFSGVVRRAFRELGHNAYSCDLKPATDGAQSGVTHFQQDAFSAIHAGPPDGERWNLVIAHPVCTYLCNSGALRLYIGGKKANGPDADRWEKMRNGARFFRRFFDEFDGPLCAENPVMHGHALAEIGQLPGISRQTVQPYQFGDDASKATVLWLRGLPALEIDPRERCNPRMFCPECGTSSETAVAFGHGCKGCGAEAGLLRPRWSNQTDSGQNKLAPSPTRGAQRAVTYTGIAKAMAAQWSKHLLNLNPS